jgi:hypothetical protein
MTLHSHTMEFVNFAVNNDNVDSICLLYLEARDNLRVLLMRSQGQGSFEVHRELAYQDSLLTSLAESDRFKARLFGFAISYGMLRTLAATFFTLGVGLFSIMRANGVFFVWDSYCPAR